MRYCIDREAGLALGFEDANELLQLARAALELLGKVNRGGLGEPPYVWAPVPGDCPPDRAVLLKQDLAAWLQREPVPQGWDPDNSAQEEQACES